MCLILVTAPKDLSISCREAKDVLKASQPDLLYFFTPEKVEQEALAFCVLFVLMPNVAGEDEARLDARHYFARLKVGQRFKTFDAEFDHVQQVKIEHAP